MLHELKSDLAEVSVEEAYKLGITFCDACYVALSRSRGAVMYNADAEAVLKVSSLNVRHLSEFSP